MDQFSHFFTASLTNTSSLYQALTGHGWSQCAPCQPAVQTQEPSAALHFAPLVQWQVALHPGPQVPSEQGVEQSGPRQPAETSKTISHVWLFKQKICRPKFVPVHQDQVKHGLFLTVCEAFTFFAEASTVNRRAVDRVLTGALQRAVLPIGATFTLTLTVNPLWW